MNECQRIGQMNLLIVEDDKISLELLRRVIESDGKHVATAAADGEQAWRLLSDPATKFDACIFDIFMPNLDGSRRGRADAGRRAVQEDPVILCTAVQDRTTVQRAVSLAITHYVLKPFSRAVMLDKLNQIRAGLGQDDALDDSSAVCRRLGIEPDVHRQMVKALLAELVAWTAQVRAAIDQGTLQELFIRGRGVKGSCLNLGVARIAQHFNAIERGLQEYLEDPTECFPPPNMEALLQQLDREIELAAGKLPARPRSRLRSCFRLLRRPLNGFHHGVLRGLLHDLLCGLPWRDGRGDPLEDQGRQGRQRQLQRLREAVRRGTPRAAFRRRCQGRSRRRTRCWC